ncbi:hypothetical protein SKAU_G00046270 [Synaphobranchus kaupii]|uniref:Uncharacterized protein n=1 Tax=Synaphobranchus kaupii TaxID=118154 RepID=A0A9Q1G250_SYNKA|nr:hypothetical protein SKAU_G00046270 [Synaphobranchus kaupii]
MEMGGVRWIRPIRTAESSVFHSCKGTPSASRMSCSKQRGGGTPETEVTEEEEEEEEEAARRCREDQAVAGGESERPPVRLTPLGEQREPGGSVSARFHQP